MSKIAVFDSGLGSLSIIKAIQQRTKTEIVYLADQKNYPYGKKSKGELKKIIKKTIRNLQKKFNPKLIIVGSNTPSILFSEIFAKNDRVIGVFPPLLEAQRLTKTNSVAMLVTHLVANSHALSNFIKKHTIKRKIKFVIIDASELVDLVESGKFITEKNFCSKKIISILQHKFITNNVDVVTLSSTHLPFLLPLLQKIFPNITFLDPANTVADQIANHKAFSPSKKNSLKIFSTGNTKTLQTQLRNIKIRMAVQQIDI